MRCHDEAVARGAGIVGTQLVFVVAADGSVQSAEVTGADDATFAECVQNAIVAMRFPAFDGGGTVTVRYPLNVDPK